MVSLEVSDEVALKMLDSQKRSTIKNMNIGLSTPIQASDFTLL